LSSRRRSRKAKAEEPNSQGGEKRSVASRREELWLSRAKHFKKEELNSVAALWEKEKQVRTDRNPDKHAFFDLLYLGFVGHIENRGRVEKELKELKTMLDKTADMMMAIVEKSEGRGK